MGWGLLCFAWVSGWGLVDWEFGFVCLNFVGLCWCSSYLFGFVVCGMVQVGFWMVMFECFQVGMRLLCGCCLPCGWVALMCWWQMVLVVWVVLGFDSWLEVLRGWVLCVWVVLNVWWWGLGCVGSYVALLV